MTIKGKPKRVPRKIKKQMDKVSYMILMKNESASWRADIRMDMRTDMYIQSTTWVTRYYGHKLFLMIKENPDE
jgi:hypothetical protein